MMTARNTTQERRDARDDVANPTMRTAANEPPEER